MLANQYEYETSTPIGYAEASPETLKFEAVKVPELVPFSDSHHGMTGFFRTSKIMGRQV